MSNIQQLWHKHINLIIMLLQTDKNILLIYSSVHALCAFRWPILQSLLHKCLGRANFELGCFCCYSGYDREFYWRQPTLLSSELMYGMLKDSVTRWQTLLANWSCLYEKLKTGILNFAAAFIFSEWLASWFKAKPKVNSSARLSRTSLQLPVLPKPTGLLGIIHEATNKQQARLHCTCRYVLELTTWYGLLFTTMYIVTWSKYCAPHESATNVDHVMM